MIGSRGFSFSWRKYLTKILIKKSSSFTLSSEKVGAGLNPGFATWNMAKSTKCLGNSGSEQAYELHQVYFHTPNVILRTLSTDLFSRVRALPRHWSHLKYKSGKSFHWIVLNRNLNRAKSSSMGIFTAVNGIGTTKSFPTNTVWMNARNECIKLNCIQISTISPMRLLITYSKIFENSSVNQFGTLCICLYLGTVFYFTETEYEVVFQPFPSLITALSNPWSL